MTTTPAEDRTVVASSTMAAVPPARRVGRVGALALVLALVVAALSGCLDNNQLYGQRRVNNSRAASGLSSLPIHAQAQAKAQAWANRLARENRLYHSTLSDGITARWCGLAENVGYGATSQSVHEAFMNSSGHRANILGRSWNGVGVGVARNGDRAYVVHVFIQTC